MPASRPLARAGVRPLGQLPALVGQQDFKRVGVAHFEAGKQGVQQVDALDGGIQRIGVGAHAARDLHGHPTG
jgi:hypothetical protein